MHTPDPRQREHDLLRQGVALIQQGAALIADAATHLAQLDQTTDPDTGHPIATEPRARLLGDPRHPLHHPGSTHPGPIGPVGLSFTEADEATGDTDA